MALEACLPSEQRRVQPEEVSFTPAFGELCGGVVNIALTGKISIITGSKCDSLMCDSLMIHYQTG